MLRPSGHIRIETPDAARLLGAYRQGDHEYPRPFAEQNGDRLVGHRGIPAEYAEEHLALLGLISCFIANGEHTTFHATREEIDRRSSELNDRAFCAWAVSLQSSQEQVSGGHVNIIDFEQLRGALTAIGFSGVRRRRHWEPAISDADLGSIERPTPAHYSMYVEADR